MADTTADWLSRVRANGGTPRGASLHAAISVCDKRADDIELFIGWPLLVDSWRREAERLRSLLPTKESCK